MENLFAAIVHLLVHLGPWIVFIVAFLETSFFIGLLIPAEATVLVAAFLADRGYFPILQVLAGAFAGGLLGDQVGYLLGRKGGARLVHHSGWLSRLWLRYERSAGRLFRRHSLLGITLARFVSFVRTLMPWFAGMTRIPYGRFLLYDLLGVAGWAGGSVAIGVAAGASWHAAAGTFGSVSAAFLLIAALFVAYLAHRRRRRGAPELVRIGLTGNIASGKSSVVRVWSALGAQVIDADELARRAVAPGTPAVAAIARSFGGDVLTPSGEVDRDRLREIVFSDPRSRTCLEAILHPEIGRLREAEEARLRSEGSTILVHDIPLLFEVGMEGQFDRIVMVDAPEQTRLERILRDRGLSRAEAERMIAAQMPSREKRRKADVVIENNGTMEDLERRAAEVWQEIQREFA